MKPSNLLLALLGRTSYLPSAIWLNRADNWRIARSFGF